MKNPETLVLMGRLKLDNFRPCGSHYSWHAGPHWGPSGSGLIIDILAFAILQ